jgi:hypothetical protein
MFAHVSNLLMEKSELLTKQLSSLTFSSLEHETTFDPAQEFLMTKFSAFFLAPSRPIKQSKAIWCVFVPPAHEL